MQKISIFQRIVLGVFLVMILVGIVMFAGMRGKTSVSDQQVTMWGTIPDAQMRLFFEALSEAEKQLNISYVEVPEEQFVSRLTEALAVGNGPDIVMISNANLAKLSNKLFHIPFESYPERNFRDDFIEQGEMFFDTDGIVALPFMVDPLVMYWNRDILSNVGISKPPSLWSELPDFVSKVVSTDGTRTIYRSAVALGEYRNISHAKEILQALLIQAGNPVATINKNLDGQTRYVSVIGQGDQSGATPAVTVLDFFAQFADPARATYSWNRSLRNSTDAFTAGELALYFGFASELESLRQKNPNLNYDIAELPQGNTAFGKRTYGKMYALGITNTTPYLEASFNTIYELTSPEAISALESLTTLPPVRRDLLANAPANIYGQIFYNSALASRGVPDIDQKATDEIYQEMIESVLSGRARSGQAVQYAQSRMDVLAGLIY